MGVVASSSAKFVKGLFATGVGWAPNGNCVDVLNLSFSHQTIYTVNIIVNLTQDVAAESLFKKNVTKTKIKCDKMCRSLKNFYLLPCLSVFTLFAYRCNGYLNLYLSLTEVQRLFGKFLIYCTK